MIKHIIAASVILTTFNLSNESKPKQSPHKHILVQIKHNNKELSNEYAEKIADIVYTKSLELNVDPRLVAAILMQESHYKLSAVNKKSADYGIAQINKHTVKSLRLDKSRLLSDLGYSITAGVTVLASLKHYSASDSKWWGRYHNRHLKEKIKYITMVSRYL